MNRRELLKYTASAISFAALPAVLKSQQNNKVNKSSQNNGTMKIQRLAWAGIKIELDKTTLFIDATSYEEKKDMRLTAETEYTHALITHHHPDHYDPAALKTVFDKKSRLYCSEDVLPWL